MRLIDADALINILAEMQGLCQTKAALVQNSKIWQQVKNMPTIERKTGKWIDDNCSECGQYVYHGDVRNYCPNCGADMREQP